MEERKEGEREGGREEEGRKDERKKGGRAEEGRKEEERRMEGGKEEERRRKGGREEEERRVDGRKEEVWRRKGGRSKGGDEKRNLYSTLQTLPSSSLCFCVPLERDFTVPSIKRVFSWGWWHTAATQHLGGCSKRILSSRPAGTTQ